jgi:hypothetical protein
MANYSTPMCTQEFSRHADYDLDASNEYGITGSVGVGAKVGLFSIEADYTYVTAVLSYIGLGAAFKT